MKKAKQIAALLLAVILTASLAFLPGCAKRSGLEGILESGKLQVYTNAEFPPFEFKDGTAIVGVDMEIAKAIAEELGVELEIFDAKFEGIIAGLASGKGDIAISGFTITSERKESVDFSEPYINSVQYLILPLDSDLSTVESLGGRTVGAALGYSGQFILEDENDPDLDGVLADNNVIIQTVNNALDGSLDVVNGRLEAVIMDKYVAESIVAENPQLKAIELKYEDGEIVQEEYGVAVPKGNEDLLDKINAVIRRLITEGKIQEWVIEYSK